MCAVAATRTACSGWCGGGGGGVGGVGGDVGVAEIVCGAGFGGFEVCCDFLDLGGQSFYRVSGRRDR